MNANKLKAKKKTLITRSNPEWRKILDLRSQVQKDFQNKKSLSISTYQQILDWKLAKQRADKIRTSSPDSLVKTITACYCKADHPHDELKTKIRMNILLSIPWIGIGVSSAIMALHDPQQYGAIDSRVWSALFQKDKKTLSMNDYIKYLNAIRQMANGAKCEVQAVEYILWKQHEA